MTSLILHSSEQAKPFHLLTASKTLQWLLKSYFLEMIWLCKLSQIIIQNNMPDMEVLALNSMHCNILAKAQKLDFRVTESYFHKSSTFLDGIFKLSMQV